MMFDADFWKLTRMFLVRNFIVMFCILTIFIWLLEVTDAVPRIHVFRISVPHADHELPDDPAAASQAPLAGKPDLVRSGSDENVPAEVGRIDLTGFSGN